MDLLITQIINDETYYASFIFSISRISWLVNIY